jgi:hypothetical protein
MFFCVGVEIQNSDTPLIYFKCRILSYWTNRQKRNQNSIIYIFRNEKLI